MSPPELSHPALFFQGLKDRLDERLAPRIDRPSARSAGT